MENCPELLVIVPMRLKSERLEKKVMQKISDKELCVHVFDRISEAFSKGMPLKIFAAVDNLEISSALKEKHPEVEIVETGDANSGSDRVFQALKILQGRWPDMNQGLKGVLNIQGDLPFVDPELLKNMASQLLSNDPTDKTHGFDMLTASCGWDNSTDVNDPSNVKVITNKKGNAIYFSRFAIPRSRNTDFMPRHHVGLYGYTFDALAKMCVQGPVEIEKSEGLEQLRALYLDMDISVYDFKVSKTKYNLKGVDTLEDLEWANKWHAEHFS